MFSTISDGWFLKDILLRVIWCHNYQLTKKETISFELVTSDPDDAFMFHAMTNEKFPTPGYKFVHELQDIETLNREGCESRIASFRSFYSAYPKIAANYANELWRIYGRRIWTNGCL